jgi:hypothetical protein
MRARESMLVALVAFGVYAWLCPPVSGMGDASEFTLVLATGGVAHPTGYPLYTLFGHWFCLLLQGLGIGWPLAAGLWSAAGGALAVFLLLRLGTRLSGSVPGVGPATRSLAALVPSLLFAFQPLVLGEATRAEINIWNLAWTCGTAYAFVRLVATIGDRGAGPRRGHHRAAALWGLVCGIGLAHHLTSILVSAPLSAGLVAALARRRRLSPSLLLAAGGAGLLPIASYGIIAWHAWHPARVQWAALEPSLASVIDHVTGVQYRHFLGYFDPSPYQRGLLTGLVYPFLAPGLALLLFGVLRAKEAERRIEWSALLCAALLVTAFAFRYGVEDPAPYFLPAVALGVAAAARAIVAIPGVDSRRGTAALAAAGLAGSFLIVPWLQDGIEERVATVKFERVIRSMWSAIPPDTAVVSWADDRFHRLLEYQILRGEKPALVIITPDLLFTNSMRRTIRRRFGVDPMEGFDPVRVRPGAADEKDIVSRARKRLLQNLNERTRIPVIAFDPTTPIVVQLRKPWEPPGSAGAPPRPSRAH